MLIYNDIYRWKGWGRKLNLVSGSCRLRIFDQKAEVRNDLALLKPIIVVASDVPGNKMSIRSCAGHIATTVTKEFGINPHRMLWVEYYPESSYGREIIHKVVERYDAVEFVWKDGNALDPKWRTLKPPLVDVVKGLLKDSNL